MRIVFSFQRSNHIKYLACVFLLFLSLSLFSQSKKEITSGSNVNKTKLSKINELNELAIKHWNIDLSKSIEYADEALLLQNKYNDFKHRARSYNIKGVAYFNMNQQDSAYYYYRQAIIAAEKFKTEEDKYKALKNLIGLYYKGYIVDSAQIFSDFKNHIDYTISINDYIELYTSLYFLVGISHFQKMDVTPLLRVLENQLINKEVDSNIMAVYYANVGYNYWLKLERYRAVKQLEKSIGLTNNNTIKIYNNINLGRIYFESKRYTDAEYFYLEALDLIQKNSDPTIDHLKYSVYAELGAVNIKSEDPERAISFLKQVENNLYLFNPVDQAIFSLNMGIAYRSLDSLEKANLYTTSAINSFSTLQLDNYMLGAYNSKAELFITQNKHDSLKYIINNIEFLLDKVQDYYILYDSYKLLCNYYETTNQNIKALECFKIMSKIVDSINSLEFNYITTDMMYKHDTSKKDDLIAIQSRIIKNNSIATKVALISSSSLLIIFATFVALKRRKRKILEQRIKEQKSNSRVQDSELQSSIESYINEFIRLKLYTNSETSIESLAKYCNTNRSYLSHFINEKYGKHFNAFINELRIKEAINLLTSDSNKYPLKDLYHRLGYRSYSVFNSSFKNYTGTTPGKYLKDKQNTI